MVGFVPTPLVIAHGRITESSNGPALATFARIVDSGVDMLEFDVRRTADGVLVVTHDDVSDLRSDELGDDTPRMDEVLEITSGRVALDIELKERGCAADAIVAALRVHDAADILVTSFDADTLRDVEALGTAVRTGYVIERAEALEELTTLSVDYLVPSMALVRAGILEEETVRGLPGLVWTVNEEADFGAVMADRRVSGIITDRPELAMSVRDTVLLDP